MNWSSERAIILWCLSNVMMDGQSEYQKKQETLELFQQITQNLKVNFHLIKIIIMMYQTYPPKLTLGHL